MLPDEKYQNFGPLLFNWMTGRVCHFSPLWDPIFRWLRKQRRVEPQDLARLLEGLTGLKGLESEAIGSYVLRRLRDEVVLVPNT
jgi:hypothetical protein